MSANTIRIVPYSALRGDAGTDAALERIFFEASATQSFASVAARAAFRELWLTSYLRHEPERAYVACDQGDNPVGYVIGSHRDPARTARAETLTYFADFAQITSRFPAELHVNLAGSARGQGVGSLLIAQFFQNAVAANIPGVHVVTGAASRNVSFYQRNRFSERARTLFKGTELVLLGREWGA